MSPRAHLTSVCRWHLSCRATLQRPVARLEKAVSTQSHCAAREGAERRSCQTHHHDEPAVLLVSRVADRHPRNNPISPPADHTESAAREELLKPEDVAPAAVPYARRTDQSGRAAHPWPPNSCMVQRGSRQSLWLTDGCTKTKASDVSIFNMCFHLKNHHPNPSSVGHASRLCQNQ